METQNLSDFDSESIHIKRLIAFNKYFETEIKSSAPFLQMIDFSTVDFVL